MATFFVSFPGAGSPGDVVTATATDPANNTSEFSGPVTILPGPPPSTPNCKATFGGTIETGGGNTATFAGNAQASSKGQVEYVEQGNGAIKVHVSEVLSISCAPGGQEATIYANGTVNGTGSIPVRMDLKDLGELGTKDTWRIRLGNGYDSGEQTIQGGNVQLH